MVASMNMIITKKEKLKHQILSKSNSTERSHVKQKNKITELI